ncbi:hypothetical protein [Algoriphagus sp. AGSA1]|uniref:hypothetical protein n=1 Tax=Algoriphagus sp. AGSA1 TaxID=2907213 RepID=UPI001F2F9AB2|nr:hypothetical protein [Algoriphagus sp. AGSA1]
MWIGQGKEVRRNPGQKAPYFVSAGPGASSGFESFVPARRKGFFLKVSFQSQRAEPSRDYSIHGRNLETVR